MLILFMGFSILLFSIGLLGLIMHRKNIIHLLMVLELMLLAISTNFIAFAKSYSDLNAEALVFFILTIAAAESALGLAIIIALFRENKTIEISELHALKE